MNIAKNTFIAAALSISLLSGCGNGDSREVNMLSNHALTVAEAMGLDLQSVKGSTLHVYTWSDYISPDVLEGFEKALGVTVVIDTFDSNEAMYAKLKAGGTGYDIIMPSSYQIETMAREKMIEHLDRDRLPVVINNFDPYFAAQILDPSFSFGVPYAVTYTGFAYVKDKIPADADPASWAILGNPALKGRISLLDDIREVVGAGLMYLGYSVNSTNAAEIDAAVEQILKWRSNVRKFDSESYKTEVASGATWLGQGYSTDITQVIIGDEEAGAPARNDIGFALPKEGFAIAFDEMVLASGSKNKDLAYVFMNYMYTGDVAAANMDYICGPMPVATGISLLDDDYRNLIVLDDNEIRNGQVLRSFDGAPEVQELYNRAWDRIKATEAK